MLRAVVVLHHGRTGVHAISVLYIKLTIHLQCRLREGEKAFKGEHTFQVGFRANTSFPLLFGEERPRYALNHVVVDENNPTSETVRYDIACK